MTGLYPCSSVDPLRASMDRPNIALEVVPVRDMEQKLQVLLALMRQFEGSGILYCATRDNTEIVAGFLADQGVDAVAYHAGYEPEKKRGLQEAFVRGGHKVIAATNALGMGSTLKEAVRALRQDGGVEAAVVPLTLARVQWRLGAPGLV